MVIIDTLLVFSLFSVFVMELIYLQQYLNFIIDLIITVNNNMSATNVLLFLFSIVFLWFFLITTINTIRIIKYHMKNIYVYIRDYNRDIKVYLLSKRNKMFPESIYKKDELEILISKLERESKRKDITIKNLRDKLYNGISGDSCQIGKYKVEIRKLKGKDL